MADGLRLELSVRDTSGLAANFYAADVEIGAAMRLAAVRGADLLAHVVQRLCAVDTAFMRDHVRKWFSTSGLVYEVGWDATDFLAAGREFYPFFVEYGTRFMAAQPALGPAFDYVTPIYAADMRDLIRLAVERKRV